MAETRCEFGHWEFHKFVRCERPAEFLAGAKLSCGCPGRAVSACSICIDYYNPNGPCAQCHAYASVELIEPVRVMAVAP